MSKALSFTQEIRDGKRKHKQQLYPFEEKKVRQPCFYSRIQECAGMPVRLRDSSELKCFLLRAESSDHSVLYTKFQDKRVVGIEFLGSNMVLYVSIHIQACSVTGCEKNCVPLLRFILYNSESLKNGPDFCYIAIGK